MSDRKDFVCINKDCDFCFSGESQNQVGTRITYHHLCFECDTPLEEAKPKSTSGEDILDALNEGKMCSKLVV